MPWFSLSIFYALSLLILTSSTFLTPSLGHTSSKNELSIALNAEFETINPIVNTMMTGVMVQDAVLRPLIMLTPEGKPQAVLIKEIPSLTNKSASLFHDEKGTHLKANIEFIPHAQWGDGHPVTCLDLEAAWKIGSDSFVATPNRQDYQNIQNILIDKSDPKKCTITFLKPQYDFYLSLPRPIPAHLEWPVFKAHQGQASGYERNSLYVKDISNPGLYNGPYKISEMKFGSHVVLIENEKFYGLKPYFKKVIFRFILNSSTIEANLLSGNVQMASSSGMSFDQAIAFQKKVQNQKLPYDVQFVPGSMYSHIDINLDDPILKDQKVRQALAYSFNKKEMTQSFFDNRQTPAYHFATPLDDWYTESPQDIETYSFNRRKASQLLDQAGWKMNKTGLRWKNGKKLSFTLVGVSDNKLNEMLSVYLQNQWRQIGIEVFLKNYPARVFFADILKHRNFQLALLTWVNAPNFIDLNSLSSTAIPSAANGWAGHNRSGWRRAEVDTWLLQAQREFAPQKRIALMRKVLRLYTQDLPSLPAYYRSNNSVVPKDLKNYEMSGHNFTEFLQIEKWHY